MTVFTLASRPDTAGSKGTVFLAATNCFRVSIIRKLAFHHYHGIRSIPSNNEIKGVLRRRQIITNLYVRDYPKSFQPGQVVYDGKAGLYTSKDLGSAGHLHFEVRETYQGTTGGIIHIELKEAGFIPPEDFDSLVTHQYNPDSALTAQQIMNLLLHNSTPPEFRKVATRNTMYSMTDQRSVTMGLLFVRGCFASVRLAREHLLLNVDVCSAIMYESGDLITVAARLLELSNCRDLSRTDNVAKLLSVLKRVRVRQTKGGKIGRIRTIKDIVPRAGEEKFNLEDGTETTVAEFFFRAHNFRLRFPTFPGIRIIKKDRYRENTDRTEIIPFEVLEVIEGQFYRRRMNQRIHQQIHEMSVLPPNKRMAKIKSHLQAFNPAALNSAGLHVDRDLVSVRGRLLPPPDIRLKALVKKPKDGAWKFQKRNCTPFWRPCTINCWAALVYERDCDVNFAAKILRQIQNCLKFFGVDTSRIERRKPVIHQKNPQADKLEHLQELLTEVQAIEKRKLSLEDLQSFLVLVFLPGGGKSVLHEEIKRVGDTTASPGVITQCLSWDALEAMDKQISGLVDQYVTSITLKINAKMGGINFVPIKEGLEWIYSPKNGEATMVVGLDVSHPGPGIFRPSMASMVYSVDPNASRYFPLCSSQPPRLEIIQDLPKMFYAAMNRFGAHVRTTFNNFFLPQRILVYRDGLSDGELVNVGKLEIEAIKAGIQKVWKDLRVTSSFPKITYIVVGKRHHIRFFPERGQGDRSENCPSGFVTDDPRITSPHMYDFFLQSHAGLIGTSRPAHYMVLMDENELSTDALQSITFGLCHTFARATRAVSVPAPVYYAHVCLLSKLTLLFKLTGRYQLACRRAGIHIEYKDNQSMPSSMGSGDVEYNEQEWKFYDVNKLQSRLMYYA
ncbi:hypothetical protein ACEPAH_66 [Sanghuangporus vaninii]